MITFEFTSGIKPYIAKTKKEKDNILAKYGEYITKEKSSRFYKIDDKLMNEHRKIWLDHNQKYMGILNAMISDFIFFNYSYNYFKSFKYDNVEQFITLFGEKALKTKWQNIFKDMTR